MSEDVETTVLWLVGEDYQTEGTMAVKIPRSKIHDFKREMETYAEDLARRFVEQNLIKGISQYEDRILVLEEQLAHQIHMRGKAK